MRRYGTLEDKALGYLFDNLCVELGLCLPPKERRRLGSYLRRGVDVFVDEVLRADGLMPELADKGVRNRATELASATLAGREASAVPEDQFDIKFIEEWAVDDGWVHAEGEITLGAHRERFLSDLSGLTVVEYRAQWHAGVQRLVNGASFSAIWTSFPSDPSAPRFAWLFYRVGAEVHVQERLVLGPPERDCAYWSSVTPWLGFERVRQVRSDDGSAVSEWRLTLHTLRAYVERGAT